MQLGDKLDEEIKKIELPEKTVYLIGTAHVSRESSEEAYAAILDIKPDTVCIELDEERLVSLTNEQKWKDTDIFTVIKQKKSAYLLVSIILSSYQKRLAGNLGVNAGEEMLRSIEAAKEVNARLVTVDRNIKTTFMRVWRKMSFFKKMKLLFGLIFGFLDDEQISEEELKELRSKDMLESALGELGHEFPDIKRCVVDERDMYIAQKIRQSEGKCIVAVVGAAHAGGIQTNILTEHDIKELDSVEKPSIVTKIIGWAIPAVIVGMIVATLFKDMSAGLTQMKQWVLYNGTLSALGTLIAGGHIFSVLTAFVCAPITSLNPLLAAGWFAGLTEAYMRKPTVRDFDELSNDLSSLKGLWKNRLTKVLMVVVLANIGSVIGTYASGIEIFKIFTDIFK